MGYESKIYFKDGYGCDVAVIDLCKMGYVFPNGDFYSLFNKEYDKGLYVDMAGTPIPEDESKKYYNSCEYIPDIMVHEDRYGAELKYCDIKDLYKWCKANKKDMNYRRVDLLYNMVKELTNKEKWGSIYAVFYGY